jgi:3-methyl-2-oxobutanoate hydroxymethyltransferase
MRHSRVGVPDLIAKKNRGQLNAMFTAYDATMAKLLDQAGIAALLVGDSVGMVMPGYETILPVTLEAMIHHGRSVA